MPKVQLTLQAASPGGRVRKREYDVTTTPTNEFAGDRAKRKSAPTAAVHCDAARLWQ